MIFDRLVAHYGDVWLVSLSRMWTEIEHIMDEQS